MQPHAAASLFDSDGGLPDATVKAAPADDELIRLARLLPADIWLGTSSWSFPGWRDLVWGGDYSETQLAGDGLAAYAQHPLLNAVGIDRGFYKPLSEATFRQYAEQVPSAFRFVVKAPARVTDALIRGERGSSNPNPDFLDPVIATEEFVIPALRGLRERAGPLIYQLPPLPAEWLDGDGAPRIIERIGDMLAALPKAVDGIEAIHAVELRNADLLTPRLMRTLREAGARPVIAVHPRLPPVARQARALRTMDAAADEGDDWRLKGPLVARWNLHAGFRYNDAKDRYAPFDRLIDPDIVTRGALAHLVHVAVKSAQPSFVIANNKAEGSAPLTLIELARAIALSDEQFLASGAA